MRPIATHVARSMVCLSVCLSDSVLDLRVSCEKTAQLIKMPFWGLFNMGRRNHVLHGDRDPPTEGGDFVSCLAH